MERLLTELKLVLEETRAELRECIDSQGSDAVKFRLHGRMDAIFMVIERINKEIIN